MRVHLFVQQNADSVAQAQKWRHTQSALCCSEVKERMKKSKADKQAMKASQPKGGAKATKVMPKAGPKGAKR